MQVLAQQPEDVLAAFSGRVHERVAELSASEAVEYQVSAASVRPWLEVLLDYVSERLFAAESIQYNSTTPNHVHRAQVWRMPLQDTSCVTSYDSHQLHQRPSSVP